MFAPSCGFNAFHLAVLSRASATPAPRAHARADYRLSWACWNTHATANGPGLRGDPRVIVVGRQALKLNTLSADRRKSHTPCFCYYYVKTVLNVRYNYRQPTARLYTFIMARWIFIMGVCGMCDKDIYGAN